MIYKSTTDNPREIAVNPVKKYLYWLDYGQFPMIARINLDGSNKTTLVTRDISNPLDLTIDMQTHNIYWVDSREDAIFTVNFDGKNRQTIRDKLPSPKGLALLNGNVFWVDRNLQNIYKASKLQGQVAEPTIVQSGLENLRDIAIVDSSNQPKAPRNPCSGNGGCSQLCFAMSENQRVCDCSVGVLASDGKSCKTASEYIVFTTRSDPG